MRIAVIGAGIAGLTAAWLLEEEHDVTVYEATGRPGGNIRTVGVPTGQGTTIPIDLGAQMLSPTAYPHHTALRRALDITDADTTEVSLTTTLLHTGRDKPVLVTPHAPTDTKTDRTPVTGPAWDTLGAFLAAASQLESEDGPHTTTVADLAASLSLPEPLLKDTVLAWCASFVDCTLDQAARMPARAAAAWATRTPPEQAGTAPTWHVLTDGLTTVIHRLARALQGRILYNTAIRHISLTTGQPAVHGADGTTTPYDAVVLALPAPQAARLLHGCPELGEPAAALADFTYVPTTVALHHDPVYMPCDRTHWSAVCTTSDGHWAEMTAWLGAVGSTDIFKSWITHRTPPRDIIASAHFSQLLPTVPGHHAARTLRTRQGRHGVYYTGSYMHDADSQEGAVQSALDAVTALGASGTRRAALGQ